MLSIRSQNRMSLVPYNAIISIAHMIDSDYAVVANYGDVKKNKVLGLYHSKERALEVLDEIEKMVVGKLLIPTGYVQSNYKSGNFVDMTSIDKIEQLPYVYQMPEE